MEPRKKKKTEEKTGNFFIKNSASSAAPKNYLQKLRLQKRIRETEIGKTNLLPQMNH